MTRKPAIPDTVTIQVPFRMKKRGGRREVQLPPGANNHRPDHTLIKAVGRAFRWRQIIENGEIATIAELAEREKISASYLTRVMRLTLLAPDIVEAILDGNPPSIGMSELLDPMTPIWAEQRRELGYDAE